jgi:hypothetical protein
VTATATATPADASGSRAFWTAVRLFVSENPQWRMGMVLLLMFEGQILLMSLFMPSSQFARPHLAPASLYLGVLAIVTAWVDRSGTSRLAFLRLLPFARADRWLVLAPLCALVIPFVLPFAIVKHLPPLAAITIVACCWWAIAFGRWWARRLVYDLLVLPALVVAPGASYFAFRSGGWPLAAAVAMALAVVGLALSPELNLAPGRYHRLWRPRTRTNGRAAVSTARPSEGWLGWLATALRAVWVLDSRPWLRVLVFVGGGTAGLIACARDFRILDGMIYIWMIVKVGELAKQTTLQFFHVRPVSRSQLIAGALVPKLIFLLLLPLAAMVGVRSDVLSYHGLALFSHHPKPANAADLASLGHLLGATFLPQTLPASGFDPALWTAVRPLIWLHILKVSLLIYAVVFWFAITEMARDRKWRRPGVWTVPATVSMILLVMTSALFHAVSMPTPPLWLAGVLAAAAVVTWWRAKPFDLVT